MITEIPINESHIFAVELSGKLTKEDYEAFTPRLERLIEKEKYLSLLIKLDDFDGWTAKAAWQDFKIGMNHDEDFVRIAIVGESLLEKILSTAGNVFMDTEVKYFNDESDALDWLREVKNLAEQDEYIGYRHVMVATDFSEFSDLALIKAVEIAKPFNAKVSLVHAAEVISAEMYPSLGELAVPVMVDNPELEKKHIEQIKKDMQDKISELELPEDQIETHVILGHPVDTLVEYASKNNVDLIVMGSHGRRGIARLLGSSTNGVINHAPCDILTVVRGISG